MSLETFDALPDAERSLWLARFQRQQGLCDRHGIPKSVCHDPKRTWYAARTVDFAAMEADAALLAYREVHKNLEWHDGTFSDWAPERSASHPYHFEHGVTIFAAPIDLSPDDHFTTDLRAQPVNLHDTGGGG